MNDWLAENITKAVGTMICAYVFALIGIGSIVGYITGNATLALVCGAVSSYFLQLVLLPIIMVSQNKHHKTSEKILEHHEEHNKKLDQLLKHANPKAK